MPNWEQLFAFSVPPAETFVRGTVMFLGLFVLMRVVGKREGGVHSLTDLLVVVLVAQAAAQGMTATSTSIADSLLSTVTVLFWSVVLDALAYRWKPLARLLKGRASPVIVDGKINQKALRREFMSRDELEEELRLRGISDVRTVARAYLETNGMLSVLTKERGPKEPSDPGAAGPVRRGARGERAFG